MISKRVGGPFEIRGPFDLMRHFAHPLRIKPLIPQPRVQKTPVHPAKPNWHTHCHTHR